MKVLPIGCLVCAANVAGGFSSITAGRTLPVLRLLHRIDQGMRGQRRAKRQKRRRSHQRLHPQEAMRQQEQQQAAPALLSHGAATVRAGQVPKADSMVCRDDPLDWSSSSDATCGEYASHKWCTEDGDYGGGWSKKFGDFKTWAQGGGGVSAGEACCVCGGGVDVSIFKSKVGEVCQEGTAILSEQICQQAARSLGAGFAMSAHWPVGQPAGCHTDAEGKTVWLNTSPIGTTPHQKYAQLCANDVEDAGVDIEEDPDGHEKAAHELGGQREKRAAPAPETTNGRQPEKQVAPLQDKTKSGQLEKQVVPSQEKTSSIVGGKAADPETAERRAAVLQAHQALAANMKRRIEIGIELHRLGENATQVGDIDARVLEVARETHTPALAHLLGDMWKEQRQFEAPLLREHLEAEVKRLANEVVGLEEKFQAASKLANQSPEDESWFR